MQPCPKLIGRWLANSSTVAIKARADHTLVNRFSHFIFYTGKERRGTTDLILTSSAPYISYFLFKRDTLKRGSLINKPFWLLLFLLHLSY